MTAITAFLPVRGDPAVLHGVFADDPGVWLPDARHLGGDRWRTVVHGAGTTRSVVARVNRVWRSGSTVWRTVSWLPAVDEREPERVARYLPTMDGELGLSTAAGRPSLVFDARYQPPGGPLGATLDALALHRVAQATADRFLADVAAGLSEAGLARAVVADADSTGSWDDPPSPDG